MPTESPRDKLVRALSALVPSLPGTAEKDHLAAVGDAMNLMGMSGSVAGWGMRARPSMPQVLSPAFRNRATGELIKPGAFHDIEKLPGYTPEAVAKGIGILPEDAPAFLKPWEEGFVDAGGKFLNRAEAGAVLNAAGRENSGWLHAGDEANLLKYLDSKK